MGGFRIVDIHMIVEVLNRHGLDIIVRRTKVEQEKAAGLLSNGAAFLLAIQHMDEEQQEADEFVDTYRKGHDGYE